MAINIYNMAGIAWKERGNYMRQFDRFYLLIFNIIDKLTEDANTMVNEQDNKSKCIRTILLDFVKVNGIINNYTDIPAKERLERFFGYYAYSEKTAGTSEPDKRGGKHKCSFQFIISPHNNFPDGLANDVLVMLEIQNSAPAFIRALFLDFVKANGIVANYAGIPEKERLSRFFGYVEQTVVPAKQPGRTMKILRNRNIEVCQIYEGKRYLFSTITYMAPDGKKVGLTV